MKKIMATVVTIVLLLVSSQAMTKVLGNAIPIPQKLGGQEVLPFKVEMRNGVVKIFTPERLDQYQTKGNERIKKTPNWQMSVSYCYYSSEGEWIEHAPKGGIKKYRIETQQPEKKGGYIVGYLKPAMDTDFVWLRVWANDLNDNDNFNWLWIKQSDENCRFRKGLPGYEIAVNLRTGRVFNVKEEEFPEFP